MPANLARIDAIEGRARRLTAMPLIVSRALENSLSRRCRIVPSILACRYLSVPSGTAPVHYSQTILSSIVFSRPPTLREIGKKGLSTSWFPSLALCVASYASPPAFLLIAPAPPFTVFHAIECLGFAWSSESWMLTQIRVFRRYKKVLTNPASFLSFAWNISFYIFSDDTFLHLQVLYILTNISSMAIVYVVFMESVNFSSNCINNSTTSMNNTVEIEEILIPRYKVYSTDRAIIIGQSSTIWMDRKKRIFGVVTLLHILVKTLLRMELATSRWKLVIRLSLTRSERIY